MASKPVPTKANRGDVAEVILGAAMAAKFMYRPTAPITVDHVKEVLHKATRKYSYRKLVPDIAFSEEKVNDIITFKISVPEKAYLFVRDKRNWNKVDDLFRSAVSYANSEVRLNKQARLMQRNNKQNRIVIHADGTSDQKITKADISLMIDGKKTRNQISLKVSSGDQFAQISGISFDKQIKLWGKGLSLNVTPLKSCYEKNLEKFDESLIFHTNTGKILDEQKEVVKKAARAVYAEAANQLNALFDRQREPFMKNLLRFIRAGATGSQFDQIELVKLDRGSFKRVRFDNKEFDNLLSGTELKAVLNAENLDPVVKIIDEFTGRSVFQIRFRVEIRKSGNFYKIYPRNYVEAMPDSIIYGK